MFIFLLPLAGQVSFRAAKTKNTQGQGKDRLLFITLILLRFLAHFVALRPTALKNLLENFDGLRGHKHCILV